MRKRTLDRLLILGYDEEFSKRVLAILDDERIPEPDIYRFEDHGILISLQWDLTDGDEKKEVSLEFDSGRWVLITYPKSKEFDASIISGPEEIREHLLNYLDIC